MPLTDEDWMQRALELAHFAEEEGEVPVGAVVVATNDQCLGEGWNTPVNLSDPTAHAEIIALREAAKQLQNYRLVNTTLYVTLEPCAMCVGAIIHARIERLVFGTPDSKRGAVCSAVQLIDADFFNHKVRWEGGILATPCAEVLQRFFRGKRKRQDQFLSSGKNP